MKLADVANVFAYVQAVQADGIGTIYAVIERTGELLPAPPTAFQTR